MVQTACAASPRWWCRGRRRVLPGRGRDIAPPGVYVDAESIAARLSHTSARFQAIPVHRWDQPPLLAILAVCRFGALCVFSLSVSVSVSVYVWAGSASRVAQAVDAPASHLLFNSTHPASPKPTAASLRHLLLSLHRENPPPSPRACVSLAGLCVNSCMHTGRHAPRSL